MYNIEPSKENVRCWILAANGPFSIEKAYSCMFEAGNEDVDNLRKSNYKSLWGNYAPKRVHYVWKMLKQRLPTEDNLRKRSIILVIFYVPFAVKRKRRLLCTKISG